MAQDSSDSTKTEVDLEEIEVEILVIAKKPNLLSSAAGFLNRRGWPTIVMSDVTKAIEHISKNHPDFVLLSINHPSPAVLRLPSLLGKTFETTPVLFAEVADTTTANKLNRTKATHKVQGQASGPNIYRTLRKFIAEKLNLNDDSTSSTSRAADDSGPNVVTVKGGESKPVTDAGTIIQKADKKSSSFITVQSSESATVAQGAAAKGRRLKDVTRENVGDMIDDPMIVNQGENAGPFGPEDSSSAGEVVSSGKYTLEAKRARRSLKSIREATQGGESAAGASTDLASALQEALKTATDETETQEITPPFNAIEEAVKSAVEKVCKPGGEIIQTLELIDRVAVFPFDSTGSPGYVVLCVAGADSSHDQLLPKLEKQLRTSFDSMGIKGVLQSGFWLDIPTLDYHDWTSDNAEFSHANSHEGRELGVAFFSSPNQLPQISPSEVKDMVSVKLIDISSHEPVNFKAYLRFVRNEKNFLYLRNGRRIQEIQKARLKKGDIEFLLVKAVELGNVRAFFALVHLKGTMKLPRTG